MVRSRAAIGVETAEYLHELKLEGSKECMEGVRKASRTKRPSGGGAPEEVCGNMSRIAEPPPAHPAAETRVGPSGLSIRPEHNMREEVLRGKMERVLEGQPP